MPYNRNPLLLPIGKRECKRCGSIENLERDHIFPLKYGGEDYRYNLQWLCYKCHKFKSAKDIIENEIRLRINSKDSWSYKMWQYRLLVLEFLNPIDAKEYHQYSEDKFTGYEYWFYYGWSQYISSKYQETVVYE